MTEGYVQINIGMPTEQSTELGLFRRDVEKALEDSVRGDFPVIEVHEGLGSWGGKIEQSLHISTVADVDTYALRVKLRGIAEQYNQDAIALIVGSDLITKQGGTK